MDSIRISITINHTVAMETKPIALQHRDTSLVELWLKNTQLCKLMCRQKFKLKSVILYTWCSFVLMMCLTQNMTSSPTSLSPQDHMTTLKAHYTPRNTVLIPLNHTFILSNTHICKRGRPYMIIVVPSREKNYKERQAIRDTIGKLSRDKVSELNGIRINHNVRLVFFVGKSDDGLVEMEVYKENKRYQDVVQIDMVDTYYNLTLKVLMSLKWVNTYCPDVRYILKSDDDVFVHVGILLNQIHSIKHSVKGNVFGKLLNKSEEFIVNRGTTKTAVQYEEYPIEILPPYSQGTSYTLTRDLVPKILKSAPYLPYLHLEDVFITGIVAGQIHGAHLVKLNRTSDWRDSKPVPCMFALTNQLAKTKMTPQLIRRTWNVLLSPKKYCKTYDRKKITDYYDDDVDWSSLSSEETSE